MTVRSFVELGDHHEHSVVMERVLRLEGLPESRAGHLVLKDGRPNFSSTLLAFDDGTSIVVPHTKNEVLRRFLEAGAAQRPQ